jgi:hypothetical protein
MRRKPFSGRSPIADRCRFSDSRFQKVRNGEAGVMSDGLNRRVRLITVSVWAHAAVLALHSAAHVGSGIWMTVPATIYIWVVIIIGPIAGWWLMRLGRLVVGSSIVATCMAGAFVFGGVNHFVFAGSDHVSTIPAGVWRVPFQASAVLLAFSEAAGAVVSIAGVRAFVHETRRR